MLSVAAILAYRIFELLSACAYSLSPQEENVRLIKNSVMYRETRRMKGAGLCWIRIGYTLGLGLGIIVRLGTSFSVIDGPGGPFIPETDGPGGPLMRGAVSSMTGQ